MSLDMVRLFQWDSWGTYILILDVDEYSSVYFRLTLEEGGWRGFDKVKHNVPYNHTRSAGGTSLFIISQNKA